MVACFDESLRAHRHALCQALSDAHADPPLAAMQVAGVEATGREHDPILFDIGSESQTRIDIRQAGL